MFILILFVPVYPSSVILNPQEVFTYQAKCQSGIGITIESRGDAIIYVSPTKNLKDATLVKRFSGIPGKNPDRFDTNINGPCFISIMNDNGGLRDIIHYDIKMYTATLENEFIIIAYILILLILCVGFIIFMAFYNKRAREKYFPYWF